jgi:sarcosine oxidase subunit alpha
LTAGRAGLRVILVEQGEEFGGVLNWESIELDDLPAPDWVQKLTAELKSLPNVILLPRSTVTGIYDHLVTGLLQNGKNNAWRECFWTIRPRHILLATGAIEQGLIFPGNDRPGIMLASAVRQYLNRFAVRVGENVIVSTNNDSAYQTVFDLHRRGIKVNAVVDVRQDISESLRKRLAEVGTYLLPAARIKGTRGDQGITSVQIEDLQGNDLGSRACDLLAVSGGWAPRVHLLAHARGSLRFDDPSQSFLPDQLPEGVSVAGSVNGATGLAQCLTAASECAADLCKGLGKATKSPECPIVTRDVIPASQVAPVQIDTARPRQWIDLAHDVTFGDAELAVREGYVSVEHFKRYTTTGMSVDQGKTGNLNAFIVLGALTGRDTGEVGTTTFRPPYMPVTLGAIAGRNTGEFYAPRRYLPAHTAHQKLNACFEDYGWQRPDCYPSQGESNEEAIFREARTVRSHVGVFDNSPIGKLEVRGPDAAEFLNRVYINNVLSLKTGRSRYGLMLNENGVIIDDGVFTRLADEHFLLNTTSANVARIHSLMEELLQCEWTDLRVIVDDLTTQWANFTVAGPNARKVIDALDTSIDLSAEALPHMAAATGTIAGLETRICRVSFSGERSYEINIPARNAADFLIAIMKAGKPFGIVPYGIEALMVLRTEKGYLHVGSDTDGSSTPDDVGWGGVARNKATDYIGKRSLFRPANQDPDRKQLVGIEALEPGQTLRPGGHLLMGKDREPPAETDGWITSACFSPSLEHHIALAVLKNGREKTGEILTVCDEDQQFAVRVVPPVFYDPENKKLRD